MDFITEKVIIFGRLIKSIELLLIAVGRGPNSPSLHTTNQQRPSAETQPQHTRNEPSLIVCYSYLHPQRHIHPAAD